MKKIAENLIVYETKNFVAFVPKEPHISREDGGHIVIRARTKYYDSRIDLPPKEAIEVMRLTTLVGEPMIKAIKKRGVEIARINYQENGNWAYLKGQKPMFYIHLYGRTKTSKIQKWGESLLFPNPKTGFYKSFRPFDEQDIIEIRKEIKKLEQTTKYNIHNW